MAKPPIPTSSERRAQARAKAQAAAHEASDATVEESRKLTAGLLRGSADARFDALSDDTLTLTASDRRHLVRSLAGKEPPRRVIPAGTASRWALIRSRLPYRAGRLTLFGLAILGVTAALLVARSNTPEGLVLSTYPYDVPAAFVLNNGQIAFDKLEPNKRYGLVREGNGEAVLRQWVQGVGYAEAHLPADSVRLLP